MSLDIDDELDEDLIEDFSTKKANFLLKDFFGREIDIGDCFVTIAGIRHKYLATGVLTGYKVTNKQIRVYYKLYSNLTRGKYFLYGKMEEINAELIKIENVEFLLSQDKFVHLYKLYLEVQDKLSANGVK